MSREDARWVVEQVANSKAHRRWDYYQGEHPPYYVTAKLREMFQQLADSMRENYCGLAVNSRVSRMRIEGWIGPGAEQAEAVWTASRLAQQQDRLFRWSLAQGEALILADTVARTLAVNPATLTAVRYSPDDPDVIELAGKTWLDANDTRHVTLYYADLTQQWEAEKDSTTYELVSEVPQPADVVPAVVVRPYGDGPVLIDQIAPVQDRINKIGANKMVAAEFGAFRQRAFITTQELTPYAVRQAPDHAITMDPGDKDAPSRIHEFSATDLTNYDSAKTAEVDSLFTIAALPRHMRVNPGTSPSGEAVKADEGPHVQAIRDHQRESGEALVAAMAMLDIETEPVWADPETNMAAVNAQTFVALVQGGIPWQDAAKEALGWDDDRVAQAAAVPASVTDDDLGRAVLSGFGVTAT